jgi:hypothetical protein
MIGITAKNTIIDAEIDAVHYNATIKKHTLMIKYLGGEINILIDSAEFGNFMTKVVESHCEGIKHLVDEMKKKEEKNDNTSGTYRNLYR